MDGTLLDTEVIYQKYELQAANELGLNITREDLLNLRSLGNEYAVKFLADKTGVPDACEKLKTLRKSYMDPLMERIDIPLKPTAASALTLLKDSGARLGVATATGQAKTMDYLERAGIKDFFDEIVCVAMVPHGKPKPDVYLYACSKVGSVPEDTFAVEDAPNGVKSASSAGCRTIMVPDLTQPDDELSSLIEYKADTLLDAARYILSVP